MHLFVLISALSLWLTEALTAIHTPGDTASHWTPHTFSSQLCVSQPHSNHVTSSKQADTLIYYITMRRNSINYLYNLDHVTLWCLEVVPMANASEGSIPHSNHVISSKQADTLIYHITMRRNSISFLYNLDHMTLWCVEVGPVANAREGSMQEHDWARVHVSKAECIHTNHAQLLAS